MGRRCKGGCYGGGGFYGGGDIDCSCSYSYSYSYTRVYINGKKVSPMKVSFLYILFHPTTQSQSIIL